MTRMIFNVEGEVPYNETDALMTSLVLVTFPASHRDSLPHIVMFDLLNISCKILCQRTGIDYQSP